MGATISAGRHEPAFEQRSGPCRQRTARKSLASRRMRQNGALFNINEDGKIIERQHGHDENNFSRWLQASSSMEDVAEDERYTMGRLR